MNLANKLTVLRIALIPLFLAFVLSGLPYSDFVAEAIFLTAAVTDALDGYVARKRKEITNLGKLLDPLADKLLVAAAIICLVEIGRISTWVAVVIIGREFLVTGLRGVAATEGIVIAASKAAKFKTVIQIAALAMLIVDDFLIGLLGFSPGVWILYLAVALTVYSGIDYVVKTFARIKMM